MAGQSITFDFLTRGADSTAGGFRKVADNTVLAAKGAKVLSDAIEKLGQKEDRTAAESKLLASALRQTGDAEDRVAARAVLADAAIRRLDDAMQDTSKTAEKAGAGFGGLAGAGGIPGGGMGAAIAAGVALSPVLVTLGVGLGGLGLAAAGVIAPIEKAAGKTGGLAANMAKLDPLQRTVAVSILGLGKQYHAFQDALKPEILGIFNTGIKLAGGLLKDVQPVAAATGKAFGTFLGQIDTEFKSRTWQDFFGFMAAQAGPDMKLVANAILPLLDTLPKLLTDIQPIAVQFLQAAAGAFKLGDAAVTLNEKIQHLGTQAGQSGGFLGRFADAGKKAVAQMLPGIPAAQALGKWLGIVGGSSDKAATSTGKAGDAFKVAAPRAETYAQWVAASAKATTALATAQSAAVSTQLAYGNDILTSANDAQTFHDKLKASANQIGLHTQAQRDSFGAANTYIGDLSRQALAAITSGHGTDAAITAIRNGLPALDSAKTKNRQYWQEVQTLIGFLDKLRQEKAITEAIHVTGAGVWTVTPGKIGLPGGSAGGPFAFGGQIGGHGGPRADNQLIAASTGEFVHQVAAVNKYGVPAMEAVNAGRAVIGYASGGVVGSYGPASVGGLPRWTAMETNATVSAVAKSTAAALVAGISAAQKAAAFTSDRVPNVGSGVARWRGLVIQALGMEGLSRQLVDAVLYQMQTESGGNPNAINLTDINAQHGDPSKGLMQVIGATFRAYHWPGTSGNIYDPLANIAAALNYARHNYGPGLRNAQGGIGTGHGYALGGLVQAMASGGQVGQQGAAWLKAWQTRHGGGFGAAWGPAVLNQQIPEMAAAMHRAQALSGAAGLSPGQHRFWAAAALDEKKRLGVLGRELTTERAWRTQLGINELGLDKQIRAAGNLPSLAGAVKGWKAQMGRDKATVTAISKMLGYSDAYLASHKQPPPGPVLPAVTHTYGGDVANNLGTVLAAALGPFTGAARGGMVMDSGGTLKPGYNGVWNMTGRPESLVPARGGGGVTHLHLTVNGPVGSPQQLEDWFVRVANKTAQHGRLSHAVKTASR